MKPASLKHILLPTLSALALSGSAVAASLTTFSDTANHFSLSYPKALQRDQAQPPIMFVATQARQGGFRANVNVVVEQEAAGTSLDMVHQSSLKQIQSVLENLKVETDRRSTLGGLPAWDLVYSGTAKGLKLRIKQRYTVQGSLLYVLTQSNLQSDKTANSVFAPVFSSFKFLQ